MSKTIGILGGVSYLSTILYYRYLNEQYSAKFGAAHSCPMQIRSIDYHEIKSRYTQESGWNEISGLLRNEIELLMLARPGCLIIANNTLHKAFDQISKEMNLSIPVLHAVQMAKEKAQRSSFKKVLMLGTRFTMEDNYFKEPLTAAGIEVIVPDLGERLEIGKIHTELLNGGASAAHLQFFLSMTRKYDHMDAIILACTELPLIFDRLDAQLPVIDTMKLQCDGALQLIGKN